MRPPKSAIVTHKVEFSDSAAGAQATASLVLIHPPMPELGQARPLTKEVVMVGREGSADFAVTRPSISRRHAELRYSTLRGWCIADMGSTNGTFLNEEEVDDACLKNGDHLQFGDAIFKFVSGKVDSYHERVRSLAALDGLTALYNQWHFVALVNKEMNKAKKAASDVALLVLDVDRLGELNQKRGHACSDAMLRIIARHLVSNLGSSHTAARIGGGEFAILAPGTELRQALVLGEKIRATVSEKVYSFEGEEFPITISVGVAASAEGELQSSQIILEARKQLQCAKAHGRNRTCPDVRLE